MAEAKKQAETSPDLRGPRRSTISPRNPAESPRNKMAIENAHVVSERDNPIPAITGFVRTLQAYTLPMQI